MSQLPSKWGGSLGQLEATVAWYPKRRVSETKFVFVMLLPHGRKDDTDIEFVTLHALMEHGLGLNYKQIAGYWRNYVHIQVNGGDALWFANKVARENMNRGEIPPQTGSQGHNRFWWTIDPQLVNEIWSAVYPGMVDKAGVFPKYASLHAARLEGSEIPERLHGSASGQ